MQQLLLPLNAQWVEIFSEGLFTVNNYRQAAKGQLISKADWRAVDSPKKRTDEFDLFAVKSKKANKSNSSVRFLGESMARQSAFEIN